MGQAWSTFLVPGLPSCSGGAWPMLAAARAGDHRHLVKFAQQEPLLLLSCTVKGHSLAHMAAEAGSLDTLQLLVQLVGRYAVRLSARLEEVLSWSASGSEMLKTMRSQAHMCQLLDPQLMLSALLSWQDIKGVTPLMLASRGGHAECLELLLRHGANPLLLDSVNNRSCLHYAAGAGHARCINILLNEFVCVSQPAPASQQQPDQPQQQRLVLLPEATLKDSIRGMTSFVDLRTRTGFSALHYATFWGFLGCVQALLTAGATIDLPMLNPSRQHSELPVVNGSTPLHLAAEYGHTAIAALLLHAHVDRMERRLPAHLENHREDQEWLPWEGAPNQDPRVRRNVSGDTPHSVNDNRCNSSSVLKVLLDPFVPVTRTLPLVVEAIFGGRPRFGVPKLGVLAKAALDQHLNGTLSQLEQQQEQQEQQRQLSADLAQDFIAGALEVEEAAESDTRAAAAAAAAGVQADAVSTAAEKLRGLPGCTSGSSSSSGSLQVAVAVVKELADTGTLLDCGAAVAGSPPGCGMSSTSSTPAASRSTSYGSISSLGSSSSTTCCVLTASLAGSYCSSSAAGCLPRAGSSASLASCSSVGAGCGLHNRCVSIDSTIAESVVASSLADSTCAICFDASANVMMAGCCHCVCTSCARSLLDQVKSGVKPALCPFCRAGLTGFVAAPSP